MLIYTTYEVGNNTITKTYNYDNDSLKRLNNIALSLGSITLSKIINYDNDNVDTSMGDSTTRILSIVYAKNGIQQALYLYHYDNNNNITELTVKNQYGQTVDDYDYYYDGFNQLIRENVTINSGAFARTYLYSYDDQGNITSIADHAYTLSDPVITTPLVLTYYGYSNTWKDQLTKITEYTNFIKTKEITYSYDANGNPTAITDLMVANNSKTLNWDGRQLNSLSYYCGGMSFKYNDQGIRTYKSIGGCSGGYAVSYVLDGSRILSETKGTATIYYTYDADGTLVSMNYNGNEYFYITNMQGDVVELVDISGTTVVKYKYDAWGSIIYQFDSGLGVANANPFRYRSYYYDIETGWYYLQSRYYNPSIGRFISADGLAGQQGNSLNHNMYAYCLNNPVVNYDSNGEKTTRIALLNTDEQMNVSPGLPDWFYVYGFYVEMKIDYSIEISGSPQDKLGMGIGVGVMSFGARYSWIFDENNSSLVINPEVCIQFNIIHFSAEAAFNLYEGIGFKFEAELFSIEGGVKITDNLTVKGKLRLGFGAAFKVGNSQFTIGLGWWELNVEYDLP